MQIKRQMHWHKNMVSLNWSLFRCLKMILNLKRNCQLVVTKQPLLPESINYYNQENMKKLFPYWWIWNNMKRLLIFVLKKMFPFKKKLSRKCYPTNNQLQLLKNQRGLNSQKLSLKNVENKAAFNSPQGCTSNWQIKLKP